MRSYKYLFGIIAGLIFGLFFSIFLQIANGEETMTTGCSVTFAPIENPTVIISKSRLTLQLISQGKKLKEYKISTGKNSGNKQKKGDCRTPLGTFKIISIEDSSAWKYDFEDDNQGPIAGAYGPLFFRLDTPVWEGIGIHGTHDSNLIGFHNSHGCIRMKNEELLDFASFVTINTLVTIKE